MVFPSFLLHHLSIASLPPALIWFPSQLPSWAVRLPRAGRGRSFFLNIQMAKGALSGWVVQLALRETNLPTSTSEQFQSCWLPHPPDIPFPLLSSPQTPCFPPPAPDHFSTSPYTNSTLKEALSCLWALGLLLGSLPFFSPPPPSLWALFGHSTPGSFSFSLHPAPRRHQSRRVLPPLCRFKPVPRRCATPSAPLHFVASPAPPAPPLQVLLLLAAVSPARALPLAASADPQPWPTSKRAFSLRTSRNDSTARRKRSEAGGGAGGGD